jgi:hypothetical protein
LRVVLASLFAITTGGLSTLALLPRITVEAGAPVSATDALTAPFTITNTGVFTVRDVEVGIAICEINEPVIPPPTDCDYSNPSVLVITNWKRNALLRDEHYTITPRDLFNSKFGVQSADIGIYVSVEPWQLPIKYRRIFRFRTTVGTDNRQRWFSAPLE